MWLKSLIAPIWGFVLAVSVLTAISQLGIISADTMLLIGLILIFVLWVGVMVYCYSRNSIYHASVVLAPLFGFTLFVNLILFIINS